MAGWGDDTACRRDAMCDTCTMARHRIMLSCLATSLLLCAAQDAPRERPPWEPFKKWDAETPAEKRLDALITEVVTILANGTGTDDFRTWESRDIAKEYGDLGLMVPKTVNAHYTGKNFLFLRADHGTIFHAWFKRSDLDYFVPSICRKRAVPGHRIDRLKFEWEGVPMLTAHAQARKSRRELNRYFRATLIPVREMSCGVGVKLGFYDSTTLRLRDGLSLGRKYKPGKPLSDRWVGLSIYYPREPQRR